MYKNTRPITVLIVDDADDRLMAKEAMEELRLANYLHFVEDGEELVDYLYHRGKYSDPNNSPRPGLILLDLNMPRKDGREALKEIKEDLSMLILEMKTDFDDIVNFWDLS